jgi:crossover junction endodeoxyribonuclease RuvC
LADAREALGGKVRRVLGIDASLRSTGLAVVEAAGSRMSAVTQDVVCMRKDARLSTCLASILDRTGAMLAATRPDAASIEGAFYARNARTSMVLGEARGVAIAACAACGVPVYEYAPRRVKQGLVGYGSATKEQVRRMVMTLLSLRDEPREDAGDALALAICHLHSFRPSMPTAAEAL